MNNQISKYKGARDNKGSAVSIDNIIGQIRGRTDIDALKKIITSIRDENDKAIRDSLKKTLEAVTWSGLFEKRKADKLIEYSDLICADIDGLDDDGLHTLKKALISDPFVFFCFISPSGAGLKVIFKVIGGPELHLENFINIEKYFLSKYKIKIDKSGKDVCRLCFLSYDPLAYYNPDSLPFVYNAPADNKKRKAKQDIPDKTFSDVVSFTNQKLQFASGNRNNWIHLFACNANRSGFTEADTLSFIKNNYAQEDMKESEVKASIQSAFKNTYEHGKFESLPGKKTNPGLNGSSNQKMEDKSLSGTASGDALDKKNNEISEEEFQEKYQFFDIKWKVQQDKEGNTTRIVNSICINYLKFLAILTDLGFRRIDMDKGHYFIYIENNIIEEVDNVYIKGAFKRHMETMPEIIHVSDAIIHRDMILNYLMGRQGNFFDPQNILCHLPILNMDQINQDTQDESYFYYTNKCVKITAENIELLDYSELSNKYVWSDSILTRDINLLDFLEDQENNIWAVFLGHVCDGDSMRLLALMRIIGFLMHKYYEGKMKAIVFTDSRISDDPQGRTGKGLIFKGIKQMMNRDNKTDRGVLCTINGKEFKLDNERRYEKCDINTRVVHINDVKANYDVECHYNEIEDGITVNKKFQLPFTIHAKIGISTNRTLKIAGDSSLDRFQVFDLSSHYSKEWTPEKEFGKWFFRDFTEHEWAMFDTFMLQCMQYYLKEGLLPYKSINLEKRLLHEQIGEDMINFLDDFPNGLLEDAWAGDFGLIPDREYEKKALYKLFVDINQCDVKRYTQRRFTKKLRYFKHLSEKWKSDSQDKEGNYFHERRSNGKDYIQFILNK